MLTHGSLLYFCDVFGPEAFEVVEKLHRYPWLVDYRPGEGKESIVGVFGVDTSHKEANQREELFTLLPYLRIYVFASEIGSGEVPEPSEIFFSPARSVKRTFSAYSEVALIVSFDRFLSKVETASRDIFLSWDS